LWFAILANRSSESFDPSVLGHSGETSRCVLPTNATHYLTNCTRARGFPGSVQDVILRPSSAAKKIDAFHDAFDRFRGRIFFCVRELFVPEA